MLRETAQNMLSKKKKKQAMNINTLFLKDKKALYGHMYTLVIGSSAF